MLTRFMRSLIHVHTAIRYCLLQPSSLYDSLRCYSLSYTVVYSRVCGCLFLYVYQYIVRLMRDSTVYSIHSLHRHARKRDLRRIVDDGNKFNPSRWESWEPDAWEYIPFNNGPLTCLGRAFGQLCVEWVLARLFQVFDGVDPGDYRTRTGGNTLRIELNSKPAKPIMCKFYRAETP